MNFQWTIVIIMLVLSAFFSGLETAFLTSDKLRIELLNKRRVFPAQILAFFMRHSSSYISTMLVGSCISLVIFSIFIAEILDPILSRLTNSRILILLIVTFISTIIILVTAEFIPKNIFRINPNRILSLFAVPLVLVYGVLYPVVFITNKIARLILWFFLGTKFPEKKIVFNRIDLHHYVHENTSTAIQRKEIENEVKIFKRALGFSKVKARDCMIPRTEIAAINVENSVDELRKMFIETRLSKIIIYKDTVDNIIGYTHSSEIFKKPATILSILLPILIVPESMPANEVLTLFIQQHKSVALVVDEFGGTAGMLTMEDIIEEIFGEIEDEHDKEEMIEKQISSTEYIFSGRLEIDYLNEKYKLTLPSSDEYTTLAGLILHVRQHIPKQNEAIVIGTYYFKILTTSNTTVDQIQVKILG